jgi:hypothetical protein
MKRWLLKKLYKGNESFLAEMQVEEFYSTVPTNLKEPIMDFFANHREILEKFFRVQAYYITNRALGKIDKVEFYNGILFYMKILIVMSQRAKPIIQSKQPTVIAEDDKDILAKVNDFFDFYKKSKEPKKPEEGK